MCREIIRGLGPRETFSQPDLRAGLGCLSQWAREHRDLGHSVQLAGLLVKGFPNQGDFRRFHLSWLQVLCSCCYIFVVFLCPRTKELMSPCYLHIQEVLLSIASVFRKKFSSRYKLRLLWMLCCWGGFKVFEVFLSIFKSWEVKKKKKAASWEVHFLALI